MEIEEIKERLIGKTIGMLKYYPDGCEEVVSDVKENVIDDIQYLFLYTESYGKIPMLIIPKTNLEKFLDGEHVVAFDVDELSAWIEEFPKAKEDPPQWRSSLNIKMKK